VFCESGAAGVGGIGVWVYVAGGSGRVVVVDYRGHGGSGGGNGEAESAGMKGLVPIRMLPGRKRARSGDRPERLGNWGT